MSDIDEKLSKLAPLRLSEEINRRVLAAARRRGVKRPVWIRQAIMAELARDEAAAQPTLTPEQASLIELWEAVEQRGIDPKKALTDALEAKLAAEAVA